MTLTPERRKTKAAFAGRFIITVGAVSLFFIALILSKEVSASVVEGMDLSLRVILPSIFPFLLLTDAFVSYVHIERVRILRRLFERLFNVSGAGIGAFFCGILCGFPIGAKMSLELYKNGIISKCECERLMSFSNNASPAYVIFAVGATLKCSIKDGIALYLIMLSSSFLTGIFIGINKEKSKNMSFFIEQKYSFTDSVKSAAQICINVCAFITTFAVICNLIRKFVASELICALVFSVAEIGNCSAYLSESCNLSPVCSFVLSAFSFSFSGACVIAQVASIGVPCARPSIIKHVTYKLVQGVISVILSFVVFTFLR